MAHKAKTTKTPTATATATDAKVSKADALKAKADALKALQGPEASKVESEVTDMRSLSWNVRYLLGRAEALALRPVTIRTLEHFKTAPSVAVALMSRKTREAFKGHLQDGFRIQATTGEGEEAKVVNYGGFIRDWKANKFDATVSKAKAEGILKTLKAHESANLQAHARKDWQIVQVREKLAYSTTLSAVLRLAHKAERMADKAQNITGYALDWNASQFAKALGLRVSVSDSKVLASEPVQN